MNHNSIIEYFAIKEIFSWVESKKEDYDLGLVFDDDHSQDEIDSFMSCESLEDVKNKMKNFPNIACDICGQLWFGYLNLEDVPSEISGVCLEGLSMDEIEDLDKDLNNFIDVTEKITFSNGFEFFIK